MGHGVAASDRTSLVSLLTFRAAQHPGLGYTFITDSESVGSTLTYAELDRRARSIGVWLREIGASGERVLLLYPPGLDFIGSFFGCLYAGAVAVPAYPPRLKRSDARLQAIARDCQPRVVLTIDSILARSAALTEQSPELAATRWLSTDGLGDELGEGADLPEPAADSLALLQYTSGSTGTPKGVKVSHAALLHNEEMIRRAFGQSEESLVVGWLPLYHDMGLIGNVLQPLYSGARCVLMPPVAFLQKPLRWLRAISDFRGTTSGGPSFAYGLCVDRIRPEQRERLDLSSWRLAFNGSEPVRSETMRRFAEAFAPCGFRAEAFYPCYGLAEATLFVSGTPGAGLLTRSFAAGALEEGRAEPADRANGRRELVSCGHTGLEQRIVVADPEAGVELPDGRVGEIWVRGLSVADGYWGREEESDRVFRAFLAGGEGPFLRTGDLGFLAGGELFVTGRLKDLIIIRGRNLYPQDVERTAEESCPDLRASSSAAFTIEKDGEERLVVVCELERRPGAAPEEIAERVRRAVTDEHEVLLHEVVLIRPGALPKTSSGKVQRRACRAAYLAGELEVVAASAAAPPEPEPAPERLDRTGLLALPPEERGPVLIHHLAARASRAAQAVRLPAARIDPEAPLTALGVDSLGAAEIAQEIGEELAVPLDLSEMLSGVTVAGLAAMVLDRLDNAGASSSGPQRRWAGGDAPLSQGQAGLWFLDRLAPEGAAYNLASAARTAPGLEPEALRRAFQALCDRHSALRTTFHEGSEEPFQRIHASLTADFQVIEAGGWSASRLEAELAAEAFRPFELNSRPPIRLSVFLGPQEGPIVLLVVHHIVADLWSLGVILRELGLLYARESEGAPIALPPLELAYADYVLWQRERLAGPEGERLWEHWRGRLAGELPVLDLPTDRPRRAAVSDRGGAAFRSLPPALEEGARRLARDQGTTLFAVVLAAFQALLSRYSGQEDLIVGTPTTGRSSRALANLVGYFVNPVPLRADLSGNPSFLELLAAARREALEAFAHQEYPLPLLTRKLHLEREAGQSPLFQVVLTLQQSEHLGVSGLARFSTGEPGARLGFGPLAFEALPLAEGRAAFDLSLMLAADHDGLAAALQFRSDLYDEETAARLLGHLEILLAAAVADPGRILYELPLLSAAERRQILEDWNGSTLLPAEVCLHELFAAQAARTPEACALVAGEERLTYRELQARVRRLARHLGRLGVGPETRVGVFLDRTPELVVSLFAVLEAGGAYVPVDPAYPRSRSETILADAGAAAVLTQRSLADQVPGDPVRLVCVDELPAGEAAAEAPAHATVPGNLAYLIYTSGSTGRPKGIAIQHRSAVALMRWVEREIQPADLAGVLTSTSVCFDMSIFEIFGTLSFGGTVILARDVLELPALPAFEEVTFINTVPSAMTELLEWGRIPAAVRVVGLGGEALPDSLVRKLHTLSPDLRVYNLYGPSEDTTYSTVCVVPREADRPPTVGRPVPGTQAYVLDRQGGLAPVGLPGELFLGGEGLARGYLDRPDLTAERFVPDAIGSQPGARLYRTGDLTRCLPDGEIEYLGRMDHQVKVRGFRVEIGEIETVLGRHPAVQSVVVVARREPTGSLRLVAYAIPQEGAGEDLVRELGDLARRELPDYMVPSAWALLESFPYTPSGKVDRRALPSPDELSTAAATAHEPPATPFEELLADLWLDLLGVQRVGRRDDFFTLGGHSLLGTRLISRIRTVFGIELPLTAVFEAPELAALAGRLEAARAAAGATAPPLQPVPHEEGAPLSFAQQRLWFLDQFEPGRTVYNVALDLRLEGALAEPTLLAALGEIARRHESLRTLFQAPAGEPLQVISPHAGPQVERADLTDLPADAAWSRGEELALALARQPFDLARGPLLRVLLLRLGESRHRLVVVTHHSVADGWSTGIFLRELAALYGALQEGLPSPLPPLPIQYADFAIWQRAWLQGEVLERQVGYWRQQLADPPEPLELPLDRARGARKGDRGGLLEASLPAPLTDAVEELARHRGATSFMALLALFATLLHRLTGREDLCVGTPIANRSRAELEGLIGFFVNTLVMRARPARSLPFEELLAEVRRTALQAYMHQDVPFEKLVEELQPDRVSGRQPFFQVLLALQNYPRSVPQIPGLAVEAGDLDAGTARFDLSLLLTRASSGLTGLLSYNADLLDRPTVSRWLRHLVALAEGAVAAPALPLGELALLSAPERHQVASEWNDTAGPAPASVLDRFEEHARRAPEALALRVGEATLTYGELDARANRMAGRLVELGVGPEATVGLCLERSPEVVVAILAAFKAGGAYVPLDPQLPGERLARMLEDAAPRVVVTRSALAGALPPGTPVLRVEEVTGGDPLPPARRSHPESLAYVLFTSGSTGWPKGVAIEYRQLAGYAAAVLDRLGLPAGSSFASVSTLSADLGNTSVYGALASGGALHLLPEGVIADAAAMADYLTRHPVDCLKIVPSHLAALLGEAGEAQPLPRRALVLGGESFTRELAERLRGLAPGLELFNHYGPTEATVGVLAGRAGAERGAGTVPLGRPLGGCRVWILDPSRDLLPAGVPGELCIGGRDLARGYLARPDLTAERFVPDPVGGLAGERLYRTGDLARVLADGRIEFLGRIDQQVKIRGYRVEPGEIEAALAAHPAVREAAVVLAERGGERRLVAWAALAGDRGPSAAELRSWLLERLPEYMVPAAIVFLEALPRTPNGKLDRRALTAPADLGEAAGGGELPSTQVETLLAGIWEDVLGVPRVGLDDSFFDLGGHSLLATRTVSRIRSAFGVEVPLRSLFENPTLRGFAAGLQARLAGGARRAGPLRVPAAAGPAPLSFSQERLWFLLRLSESANAAYNLAYFATLEGPLDAAVLELSQTSIVERHAELRAAFPEANGAPVRVIHPPSPWSLPRVDLEALPGPLAAREAERLAAAEARWPFDIARGPLVRATLLRRNAGEHVLLLSLHHMVSDAWSRGVLMRELSAVYAAFAAGRPSPLPPLPLQYADYARWQRQQRDEELERQLAYWRRQLAAAEPVLDLPLDRPRQASQSFHGGRLDWVPPAALAPDLRAFARHRGATSFMVLLTGLQLLLHRYSGQESISVGSPIANRNRAEAEPLIGFLVNTLVLRTDLSGEPGFEDLLARARRVALEAYAHQDVPFERVVEAVQPERHLGRTPLFQVVLALQNAPVPEMRLGDVAVRSFPVDGGTAKFDLTLMLEDTAAGIRGWMEYDTDLFDRATVARIFTHLETLLAAGLADPGRRISELPLLSDRERHQVLEGWNEMGPAALREEPACLHQLFEAHAARTPGAVAVVWGDARLTYGQLDRLAGRVAARLRRLGVGPEVRVGICLRRTPQLVAALFGVLKAGGAYVPLDPGHPAERLAWALADGRAAVLITEEELAGLVPEGGPRRLFLDGLEEWPDEAAEPGAAPGPGNLSYVIYTSGSTGRPKGIAIEHRSAVAMVRWTGEVLSPDDLAGAVASTSITFDVSVFELFGPLSHGGRIVLVDDALAVPTAAGEGVTLLTAVPSAVTELVRARALPPTIRTVGLGGEAVSRSLVGQLYDLPGVERVLNLYGPSEDTTYSTWAVLSPERDAVPVIGRPIRGTRAYVLDRRLQPVPQGVAGELFLGGAGLSRGYLDRPDLTAERFLPDPFGREPGGRLYRTGDLARHRPDGDLDYLGRIDHQVKVRGFRIELGEIEEALRAHPAVRQAVVVARQDGTGDAALAAFLVPEPSAAAGALEEVRAALGRHLPSYMVPATFTVLGEMPLTTTGKIDRRALAALQPERETGAGGAALLQGPVEELIAGFWSETLGVPRPDRDVDFFELGGHSLAAVRVASRIRETLGVDLPLRALFEAPTVEALAGRVMELRGGGPASELPPVLPVPRPGDGAMPLSLVQRRLWFLARLEPDSASYNMPVVLEIDGPLDLPALAGALRDIVRRHEVLRSRFPLLSEEPSQIATPPAAGLEIPRIDLRHLRADRAAAELDRLSREEAVRPFDVETGPMLRARVVQCSASRSALLLTVHHLVADGGSVELFLRELETFYAGLAAGVPEPPLPELPVQYADFAVWQRRTLTPETLTHPLAWWRDRLAELPALELPADHARPAAARSRGAVETLALAPETVGRLEELASQAGATRFMVLLAAFQALLYRYTGQRDFAIGTPVAQRDRRELEGLIGFFVNMLVMRARPFGDQPFAELIARVRESALAAHERRHVPYELLVEELRPGRGAGRKALFEAIFAHQETSLALRLPGLSTQLRSLEHGTSKFDLSLVTLGEGESLSLLLEYSTDRFERATARRILAHFAELLRGAAAAPGTRLTDLPLLSSAEIGELVVEGGAAAEAQGGRPAPVPVYRRIEERARRAPGALAVAHGGRRLTYAALDRWANRVARELRARGAGPDRVVGVLFEPCPERVVACLAALKAGAAYLPLDPAHPAERLALTLEDASVAALVTSPALRGVAPEGVPVLSLDEAGGPPEPGHPGGEGLGIEVPPEAAAYVIYTSGSTGRPKGSLLTHAGLANLTDWYLETCRMAPSDRVTQLAGPAFDVSILDLWPPLCAGASLHCVDRDLQRSPAALWRWMAEERITLGFLSTPVAEAAMEEPLPEEGLSLRVLATGGDRLHRWLRPELPFVLVNLYGPSEVTVVSTFAVLTPGEEGESAPPIGRPVTNLRVVLLDGDLRPVPKGAPGEIYVGGVGVGRGYLGRPDLTAERFVPDPLADEPGSRLYRTGDRGRLLPSGDLEFLGRIDFQVKIRGFRVEPGEVEVALGAHPAVRQAAVLAVEDEPGSGARLVAYVTLNGAATPEELRQHLVGALPDPMVPGDILLVPELPLTPNGKIDRQALPERHGTRAGRTSSAVAPRTPTEAALAVLWAGLLRRDPVAIAVDDDFYELGGHSLMATRLLARIRQTFRIDPPLRELFEAPTLEEMAARLDTYQAAAEAPPLRPRERGERGCLSFTQERLWLLDRLEPGAAYNMPAAVALRGRLDVQALGRALAEVVRRHESLRTVFRDEAGVPYQRVEPSAPVRLEVVDLSALPPAGREREAARLAAEEAVRPFDLAVGPLFRAAALRLCESEHRLLLTLHHIVADGWSVGVLIDEITALYPAALDGGTPSLPDLPLQYADFAEWQRDRLRGDTLERELGHWTARLGNPPPPLDLPTDFPRPRVQTYRGGRRSLTLPLGLTGDLTELARSSGATPFMVLLAGFSILLRRWSGAKDLIVGSPVAGRTQPEVEGMIGVFVSTLALRVDLSGNPSFQDLLARVREVAIEAYAHQEVPFEAILARVQPERDAGRTPLFQVFLNMLNLEPRKLRLPGCKLKALASGEMPSKFDLTLYAAEREGSLRLDLVYNADLFLPGRVEEMLRQLASVLAQAAADPARPVDRLSLLTPEAVAVLPDPQQPIEPVWAGPAHQALSRHAVRRPRHVALADRRGEWTYAELGALTGRLAGRLREAGVGHGDVVAVWAHRSAALALALAGAHRAGAAFAVLDPAYPPARLAAALRLAKPVAWLRLEAAPAPAAEVEEALSGLPLRCRIDLPGTPAAAGAAFASFPDCGEVAVGPDDLAYVAFTSGSTGEPKGILGSHGPLSHFLGWHSRTFGLTEDDRFSLLSGLAHDPLLRDVFTPLWVGATLCIPDAQEMESGRRLAGWMGGQGVTVSHLTPALAELLATAPAENGVPSLRHAFFGGDLLRRRTVEGLRRLAGAAACVNFYGATETPQAMGWLPLDAAPSGREEVPVGRGIEGVQLLVLNASGDLAGIGESGEIHIRTPYLSQGYLGDEALTRERFLANRLYRTGDLGRYLPDGTVEFAGRKDGQVKLRGFRIELGEIEAALAAHPRVLTAAVLLLETAAGEKRLAAYVVPNDATAPPAAELRTFLGQRLPDYMVPAAFVELPALPLTPNGKLDRRRLPAPDWSAAPEAGPVDPLQDPIEEVVCEILAELLGRERVGRSASFFELGGHSLLAARLLAQVETAFGVSLSLREVFLAPTAAGIATVLRERLGRPAGDGATLPSIEPAPADLGLPFPMTDVQQAYWVGRTGAIELGKVASHRYLELESEDLDVDRLAHAWRCLIARHGMLRAVVDADGRQRILTEVPAYAIAAEDLSVLPAAVAEMRLADLREELSHQVFCTDRWPLFEIRTCRLAEGRVRLFFSFDYLIGDAWSFQVLLRELLWLYHDPAATLPPLELSFRDYVMALERLRGSDLYTRARDYWRERLPSLPGGPELPLVRDPALLAEQRFARRRARLEPEAWRRLKARGAAAGLTPSGLLLAVFSEVLGIWTRSPRFSLVLTLFGRLPLHRQVNDLVGDFTSTTLLTVERGEAETFEARARRLQERLWSDLDHRYFSGVQVMRELASRQGGRLRSITPIVFTSTLDLREAAGGSAPALPGRVVYGVSQTPQVLLDHQAAERQGSLVLNWDAVEEVFPPGYLDEMFEAYQAFLGRLADGDGWQERSFRLVTGSQLAPRNAANDTAAPIPPGLLHEPFADQVRRNPDRIAVICGERVLTYGELDQRAEALAQTLRALGTRPNRLVGVVMEKGWEQTVAVFAILRAGGAYLPIDAELPQERLWYLLRQGEVEVAITQPRFDAELEWPEEVRRIAVDPAPPAAPVAHAPQPPQDPEDLAYVIFTSGSTGVPKGVMTDHRGALNTLVDLNERFAIGEEDRVLGLSALNFDLSVYDIFGLLAAGGALVLPDPGERRDPSRWERLLLDHRVTVWNTVPALMEMLVEYLEGCGRPMPPSLRLVMISGDWIPVGLPARIRTLAPDICVRSLGGATEASIWSILYPIGEVDPSWRSIPYGKAMVNQTFHVLDERLDPSPTWVPGELYIGGIGLAKGYWRDPEKTARSFITHPATGERLYRTGDLGRYLPSGDIEFLGREDFQVKVQGHRIELGEIESALLQHPDVRTAVVNPVGSGTSRRLVAYVVPERHPEPPSRAAGPAPPAPAPLPPPEGQAEGGRLDPLQALEFKLGQPSLRREPDRPLLPFSRQNGDFDLLEAYERRRSRRSFSPAALSASRLGGMLLQLAQVPLASRRLPGHLYASAGSLYPVQVYLHLKPGAVEGLPAGTYYYNPAEHALVPLVEGALIDRDAHSPVNRAVADAAGLILLLVGDLDAIAPVYGDMARDFCLLEAGYVGQLLMTTSLESGIGLCPVGRMDFEPLRLLFDLKPSHCFLHAFLAGPVDETASPAAVSGRPASAGEDLSGRLRRFLAGKLPHYMVPTAFLLLDTLPLTSNGKVDRRALPEPDLHGETTGGGHLPAENDVERSILEVWKRVLQLETVGRHDNFFELGGNSVTMIQVYNQLREILGGDIPLVTLFEHPTASSLARHLSDREGVADAVGVERGQDRADRRREAARQKEQRRRPRPGMPEDPTDE
ncbi:MAG: non-ribosomal peptide synthase/polyketide synthase [Thermoanaerobaculia bacterium]